MKDRTRDVSVITYEAAREMVAAAIGHAAENGWRVAAVVLDPAGHVVASGRMDGVPPPALDFAADKAFTATLGKATTAFFERMNSHPSLSMGVVNRPRLCAWHGGVPVYEGDRLVGVIGVSGAAGPDDVTCAEAAIRALGFRNAAG